LVVINVVRECEYETRVIAHILFHMEMRDNTFVLSSHHSNGGPVMSDTLHSLFRYKAWADDELLTTLGRLGAESPVMTLAIKALSHTYVVDRIFAAHLRGQNHGFTSANLNRMPTLEDLSADLRASDREYLDFVAALDGDRFAEQIDFAFTDGAPGRMSREEMLMHVITHGVGHRGQVSALMLLNCIAPAKDGFTTYLHETEALKRRRMVAGSREAATSTASI
jgi:uncharacterized damage-inducible protein DinB